jgi:hypothetical protein
VKQSPKIISVDQFVPERTLALGAEMYHYTPPIFCSKNLSSGRLNRTRPMPVASSLLLRRNERYFLVTAAHVFKKHEFDTLGLFHSNDLYYLSGHVRLSSPEKIDDDRIDLAIVELPQSFASTLPNVFKFFELRNLYVDERRAAGDSVVVVGSPLTRFRLNLGHKKVINEPFIFRTTLCEDSVYSKARFDPNTNLLLHYRRRRVQNSNTRKYEMGPDPHGLSGCGVWRITNIISGVYFPVGILTEWSNNFSALIGTRMNVVMEILRIGFGVDVAPSRSVNLSIKNHEISNMKIDPHD